MQNSINSTSQQASIVNALNLDFTSYDLAETNSNSAAQLIFRGAPLLAVNDITLGGAAANTAIFTLPTAPVFITKLYGWVTEATDPTSCTDVYFDVFDQTNSVPLTKTTTTNFTDLTVGSFFIKNAAAATALYTMKSDQIRIDETLTDIFGAVQVNPKNAVVNQIRINYTGATDFDMDLHIHIAYYSFEDGSVITAI